MIRFSKTALGIAVLLFTLLTMGCHHEETIKGNGVKETVNREASQFQSIQLNGNFDVILVGEMPQKVSLTSDSNVLQYVTTSVKDNTLYLETSKTISTDQPPLVQIFVPELKNVHISGTGKVNASKVVADHLSIQIDGSGRFNVSGTANKISINISGASEVNAQDLMAKQADIDVSGTGRVSVNASQELNVKVSGAGLIEYYGAPSKVTQSISGSGKVIGISTNAQKNPS